MSRSGKVRNGEKFTGALKNVSYISADCLKLSTFEKELEEVDAVVHTVGTLFESRSDPNLSYNAMNRDSAVNMAKVLQEYAKDSSQRNFVMISSAKAPFFAPRYLTSKEEAE